MLCVDYLHLLFQGFSHDPQLKAVFQCHASFLLMIPLWFWEGKPKVAPENILGYIIMEKNTKIGIEIAIFVISAVIAFFSYKLGDTLSRIGYAIAIGLVFDIASTGIVNIFDEEFRENSDITGKITSLLSTLVFPILFFVLYDYFRNDGNRCVSAWSSLFVSIIIFGALYLLVKFIAKTFNK